MRNLKNKVTNKIESIGLKRSPMGFILEVLGQQDWLATLNTLYRRLQGRSSSRSSWSRNRSGNRNQCSVSGPDTEDADGSGGGCASIVDSRGKPKKDTSQQSDCGNVQRLPLTSSSVKPVCRTKRFISSVAKTTKGKLRWVNSRLNKCCRLKLFSRDFKNDGGVSSGWEIVKRTMGYQETSDAKRRGRYFQRFFSTLRLGVCRVYHSTIKRLKHLRSGL